MLEDDLGSSHSCMASMARVAIEGKIGDIRAERHEHVHAPGAPP